MDMDPRNIPTAFLNIIPLSQLPEQSTFDMLFGGKTIEEFAAGYGIDYATVPVGLGWEDDDWGWMDMGDPDALDKAKYQAENPNAIMTPLGPALAPEIVEAIIDDNPGVEPLLGLTSEEIKEIEADADAIINASGDNFATIIDDVHAAAMAENLNPNEVLKGVVDEMANMPSPWVANYEAQIMAGGYPPTLMGTTSVADPIQITDETLELLEEATGSDDLVSTMIDDSEDGGPGFWNKLAEFMTPPEAQYGADLAKEAKAKEEAAQADAEYLEGLRGLSNDDIAAKIQGELDSGYLFPGSVEAWGEKHPDMQGIVQTVLGLAGQDPLDMTKDAAGTVPDVIDLDSLPGDFQDIEKGFLQDNLRKPFYQKFAGRPGAGRYEIRSQMNNIFTDSLTLFQLYGGEENFMDSWDMNWQDLQKAAVDISSDAVADAGPLEKAYNQFLDRYMANPYGTRSGPQFDAAVSEVGRLLTVYENQVLPEDLDIETFTLRGGLPGISNADARRLPWVIGMFGEGNGDASRRNLAHLYRTGGSKSYYAQQIHSVMDEMWDYWSGIGMSEAEIFRRMTAPQEKVGSEELDGVQKMLGDGVMNGL